MEKKTIRSFLRAAACSVLFFPCVAQVEAPDKWEAWVRDAASNPLVKDTLVQQTFNERPSDRLSFTTTGAAAQFDPSSNSSLTDGDGHALKLPPGSSVCFSYEPPAGYDSIFCDIHYGLQAVKKSSTLILSVDRPLNPIVDLSLLKLEKTSTTISFKKKKTMYNGSESNYFRVYGAPRSLTFSVGGEASETGYYAIDRVLFQRVTPTFTHFTGAGSWAEPTCWSHHPAIPPSTALIQGDLLIDTPVHCRALHLAEGSIRFADEGRLQVTDSLTFHYRFPAREKWVFLSLPFDLYPEDIDPSFSLADESCQETGNFFYLVKFNGERRAGQGSLTGNWETLSPATLSPGRPLMEKGKGYLMALDRGSERLTIQFTMRGKALSDDWGRQASLAITAPVSSSPAHAGWQLCGNPFPSELPLSRITPNPDLDGYIYLFDGTDYQAYPLTGDYVLPPYTAFFVKASRNTTLACQAEPTSSGLRSLHNAPLDPARSEPVARALLPTAQADLPGEESPALQASPGKLQLQAVPAAGEARIYDLGGRLRATYPVVAGSLTLPHALPAGCYSLLLQAGEQHYRYKFLID